MDACQTFLSSSHNAYISSPKALNHSFPAFFNLFSCAMRSVYLALMAIFSTPNHEIHTICNQCHRLERIQNVIGGVLWYQGCNDALPSTNPNLPSPSSLYEERLLFFLQSLRKYIDWICRYVDITLFPTDCSSMEFKSRCLVRTIVVAITTTRPWLSKTSEIRSIQTSAINFTIPKMRTMVVDAFGSFLQSDCVHLSTHSYYRLGYLLAEAMNTTVSPFTEIRSMDSLLLSPVHQYFIDFYQLLRSMSEEILESHYSTKKESLYPPLTFRTHHPSTSHNISRSLPILQTGLKPVNFVYGEISFHSIISILHEINRLDSFTASASIAFETNKHFVDLGCGSCVSLIAAYFMGTFKNIIGVDMMRSKLEVGASMESLIRSYLLEPSSSCWSLYPFFPRFQKRIQDFFHKYSSPIPLNSLNLSIREGNFLEWENLSETEWNDIKVLYICSTCYNEDDVLKQLYLEKFPHLSMGSYVIMLDKQLPQNMLLSSCYSDRKEDLHSPRHSIFELLFSRQCRTSWGVASAYIYRCQVSGSMISEQS